MYNKNINRSIFPLESDVWKEQSIYLSYDKMHEV